MSIVTWPASLYPATARLTLQTNQRVHASPFGGSEQAVDMLNDRWLMAIEFPTRKARYGAAVEAFIASLRGQSNTVGLWHFMRPAPRGTMRGTPTLPSGASQGAGSIVIQSDATANGSGVLTATLVNRLRIALSGGAAVSWDRPTTQFRLLSTSGQQYTPGRADPVSCDFGEAIA
jgi:hypothetical protein